MMREAGAAVAVRLSTTADLEDERMNIRPFEIKVSEDDLATLQRRLKVTRWPSVVESAGWQLGMDDGFLRRPVGSSGAIREQRQPRSDGY
jgi:hypothetical protein